MQVKSIGDGLLSGTRMQEEFVITSVSGNAVSSVDELVQILSKVQGNVRLEGIYPGFEGSYAYPSNLKSGSSGSPNKMQYP